MNIKKISAICFLILSCALFISAQDTKKDKDLAEQQRLEELQRLQDELNQNPAKPSVLDFNELSYFLPKAKDSWYISLTENGGFTGVSKLIAAINSDGNYLCSREQNFGNQFVAKNLFDAFAQKIADTAFRSSDINRPEEIKFCSDCLYKTLTFQSANKFYRYNRINFTKADGVIKEVYDEIMNLTPCS